jgi:Xaa-Pro aminopeptidase
MELDVLPVRDYFRYQAIFSSAKIVDTSTMIKRVRMIKSPFEIAQMRQAGIIGKQVYEEGCNVLREGMSEVEFGGHLELAAKRLEHEGLIRMRTLNYDAYTWHVLSGPSGSMVSQAESPMGGEGLSPAFPVGAGARKMKAHEPILVDFGICYNGYLVDQTRMYCIGELPEKYSRAYLAAQAIERLVLDEARPGARCGALYDKTRQLAADLGYQESFLGIPGKKTSFVAHGVGLENSEIPYLAADQHHTLQEGMTIAVEPKLVFLNEGAIGIEDTVLITARGPEKLTVCDDRIFQVQHS